MWAHRKKRTPCSVSQTTDTGFHVGSPWLVSWYFEQGQPRRIISRPKTTFNLPQISPDTNPHLKKTTHTHTHTSIKHNIFEELVPSVLPLLKKKHIMLGHAGIVEARGMRLKNRCFPPACGRSQMNRAGKTWVFCVYFTVVFCCCCCCCCFLMSHL